MLVVIPTYKRMQSLQWVLQSLILAHESFPVAHLRLCIVNNAPEMRATLDKLVLQVRDKFPRGSEKIEWLFLYRDRTLEPVLNWYSAIMEVAEEDEVVLLHGDDDLVMPWGLYERHEAIRVIGADMLLTRSCHEVIFLPDEKFCIPNFSQILRGDKIDTIKYEDIYSWGPAFIGNHCYRYSQVFRDALDMAFNWSERQPWLDYNTRTLMIPYYLPFAIKKLTGSLYGLNDTCVLRGGSLEELINAQYGVGGWNPGFISLCAAGVLSQEGIDGIDRTIEDLHEMASDWFLTFFIDKRIPRDMLFRTLKEIGFPYRAFHPNHMLRGLRILISDALGLRRLSERLTWRNRCVLVSDLLSNLGDSPSNWT